MERGATNMNYTQETKYEVEQSQTEVVDEQLTKSHIHKTYPTFGTEAYVFMCDCGAVFDEEGNQLT